MSLLGTFNTLQTLFFINYSAGRVSTELLSYPPQWEGECLGHEQESSTRRQKKKEKDIFKRMHLRIFTREHMRSSSEAQRAEGVKGLPAL